MTQPDGQYSALELRIRGVCKTYPNGVHALRGGGGGLVGVGFSPQQIGVLIAYVGLMLGVCMLACVVPTWRALSVEPSEALRAD